MAESMSLDWILFILFISCSSIQLIIWVCFPGRFLYFRKQEVKKVSFKPPVSIVICARNESENLRTNLPYVLEQEYDGLVEVVVVDDASSDSTELALEVLSNKYTNLRVVRFKIKTHPGKKQALALGVSSARYDWIVVTDADCQPSSRKWLSGILNAAGEDGIVLGYAPLLYEHTKLNTWARYETLITGLQYFSLANVGWAFMGVGRNMAWHRSVFERLSQSQLNWNIPGGDDDLLVNQNQGVYPIYWTILPSTFVYSPAKATIREWIQQKRRHLSSGFSYRPFHRLLLGGQAFTHSGHYGFGLILLVVDPSFWMPIALIYFARLSLVYLLVRKACKLFKEPKMWVWAVVLDGLMALWVGFFAPMLLILGPKRTW